MVEQANIEIAQRLLEVAELLEEQGANPYRVRAYRHAAETLQILGRPVAQIFEAEGLNGLRKLPGIGESLAGFIRDLLVTGRLPMLDRLRGEADPVALLATVPGVGQVLAARFHHDLGIDTLEDLETAAHDGRLSQIAGFGAKKLTGIIAALALRLGRVRDQRPRSRHDGEPHQPALEELLDVDREYREKAAAGQIRMIAPHRFNPARRAWLPILHTQRGERHYIALFSNTARAHQLGMTGDWVILYHDDGHGEQQCTVITARHPPLKGRRIVRGREADCIAYYGIEDATEAEGVSLTADRLRLDKETPYEHPPGS